MYPLTHIYAHMYIHTHTHTHTSVYLLVSPTHRYTGSATTTRDDRSGGSNGYTNQSKPELSLGHDATCVRGTALPGKPHGRLRRESPSRRRFCLCAPGHHTHTHTHTQAQAHTHTHKHTHIHKHTHTPQHKHKHTHTHTHTHTQTHTHTTNAHTGDDICGELKCEASGRQREPSAPEPSPGS
jgi:hypothetical protein